MTSTQLIKFQEDTENWLKPLGYQKVRGIFKGRADFASVLYQKEGVYIDCRIEQGFSDSYIYFDGISTIYWTPGIGSSDVMEMERWFHGL